MTPAALDPRINAIREDLAAAPLRGQVEAAAYADGAPARIVADSAPLRAAPRFDARLGSELLHGEAVTVYDEREGWAWVQAETDGYVGYVPCNDLSADAFTPTHRVAAILTHLYPAPDIKAPPLSLISMNALVAVDEVDGRFARLSDGRYAIARHLRPLDQAEDDFAAVAERFLGVPYLWGGRTSLGLDCSALVQLSLQAAGIACPRDTDMQEAALGEALPDNANPATYKRGDLAFWKGHVGVLLDSERLLHANAHHMATAIEPVRDAFDRIEKSESPLTSIRRIG